MNRFFTILLFFAVPFALLATPQEDFITALREYRLQDARFYLEDGHSVDDPVENGESALVIMCREQRSLQVRWLMEQQADTELTDNRGLTPLIHAARSGNRDLAQILLQNGAEINHQSPMGMTALAAAVNGGWYDLADYLEAKGGRIAENAYAHPFLSEIWDRRLHYARARGLNETRWKHHEFLTIVVRGSYRDLGEALTSGYDPDAADTENVSALMLSASRGDAYVGDLLLSRGADPHARDSMGLSALWYAAYMDNGELLNSLIESGAGLDEDYLENTALFGALAGRSYKAFDRLLEAGAEPSISGRLGAELIHYAAFLGDLRILRDLEKEQVSFLRQDDGGKTAMDYLVAGYLLSENAESYIPCASFLRDRGVRPSGTMADLDNVKLSRIIYSKW